MKKSNVTVTEENREQAIVLVKAACIDLASRFDSLRRFKAATRLAQRAIHNALDQVADKARSNTQRDLTRQEIDQAVTMTIKSLPTER